MTRKKFISTKTYDHSIGLSCAFRQWRAELIRALTLSAS
jgi:hypothetical protein